MTQKIIGALAAVALLATAGAAQAQVWRGTIEAVDNPNGTFTVTGREFVANEDVAPKLNGFPAGMDVVVSFERRNGETSRPTSGTTRTEPRRNRTPQAQGAPPGAPRLASGPRLVGPDALPPDSGQGPAAGADVAASRNTLT